MTTQDMPSVFFSVSLPDNVCTRLIRNNKTVLSQIESILLKYSGEAELQNFREFLAEKERLISASAELGDKVRLCKKQIIEMEVGHCIYP